MTNILCRAYNSSRQHAGIGVWRPYGSRQDAGGGWEFRGNARQRRGDALRRRSFMRALWPAACENKKGKDVLLDGRRALSE